MEPDRVDGRLAARVARLVDGMPEPRHLHFVLQFHPRARTLTRARLVRQPDLDVAPARAQRRGAREPRELRARQIPARRVRRLHLHAELFDQRAGGVQERGGFFAGDLERRGIDQHEVIGRDPHVHGLDARPCVVAGRTAVGDEHVRRERRVVGVVGDRAEPAREPAFVRQRALEILAERVLDEPRAGDELRERGTIERMKGGRGVGGRRQREGHEEMKTLGAHDGAHCRPNGADGRRDRAGRVGECGCVERAACVGKMIDRRALRAR
ncbi:Uncharacterised protein [Burkholderia pseudomallei]|nr:Uncharacterised protein [Burkholderia pseudomallei]CAJ9479805.1 Uncharacterised protein [Burkholderia pseudomallei]